MFMHMHTLSAICTSDAVIISTTKVSRYGYKILEWERFLGPRNEAINKLNC